ncbi:hypothetical protein [Pasteurella multocida]|uniref:hypothetical protein n=1 Tax=Pasteurella multocida TaxID=747 RepID=UPI001160BF74|nr:hypothetical protein [Pasteurella multocida]MDC4234628.1 hypothetical protein [Pasteurella multocida]
MLRVIFVFLGLYFALTGCSVERGISSYSRTDEYIVDLRTKAKYSPEQFVAKIADADYVILGEEYLA